MKMLFRAVPLLALLALPAAAPAASVTAQVAQVINVRGQYVPSELVEEVTQLVATNAASSATQIVGGNYIFAQTCSGYGTVALQVLGPDGATYMTVASYAATDTTGGHAVAMGSLATVKVVLTGTTGCNATLSRVP